MIKSKKEYRYYLEQDRIALGIQKNLKTTLRTILAPNYIWTFQKK